MKASCLFCSFYGPTSALGWAWWMVSKTTLSFENEDGNDHFKGGSTSPSFVCLFARAPQES